MSQNIEIKAHYAHLEKARSKAEALSARFEGRDHQVDTYFNVPRGRLKLRESSLSGNFLIPYLRPDHLQPKDSQYVLLPVEDVTVTRSILSQIFGVWLVVEKERHIYLWQNVRIHLDRVKNLGNFLEFEAVVYEEHAEETCQRQIEFLLEHFEISEAQLIARSYSDLLSEQSPPVTKGQNER